MRNETHDVVVCGGGPSGVAAVIAAARGGARTLLVEQTGALGGLGTQGLVPAFAPFAWHKDCLLVRGIGLEILTRLREAGGARGEIWIQLDPEKLKRVYDRMVLESGARIRFFSTIVDVETNATGLEAVVARGKSGARRLAARSFVDCTGDADVAALAGCPTVMGDDEGVTQAASLCFGVAGVNAKAFLAFEESLGGGRAFRRFIFDSVASGALADVERYQHRISGVNLDEAAGVMWLNYGHIFGVDGTDEDSLTDAMVIGREQAHCFVEFARRHIPGMENAVVVATGTLPGVRETRRIVGETVLEEEAHLKGLTHDDDIGLYDYPVDLHESRRVPGDKACGNPFMSDAIREHSRKITYGIPYPSLVPKGADNLLVAGRCISADRPMHGSTRCMPGCFAMGQAAGAAAAMRLETGVAAAALDVAELRRRLQADGVFLG